MTEHESRTDILNKYLTRYQSSKIVSAAKIVRVIEGEGDAADGLICISPDDRELPEIDVKKSWIARHAVDGNIHNLTGGYFVRYEDGYESWSPAPAFEKGNAAL